MGAEPVRDLPDGVAVGVLEVMTGGEDLDGVGTGVMEAIEVAWIEPVSEEDVGRDA